MAVITAPLLSFGARGQIAKAQVYASWKGRPYARRYTIPAYRRSTTQDTTRSVFSWLNAVWKTSPSLFQAPWAAFAKGKVLTDRNAWLSQNIHNLRLISTLDGIVLSPGALGGIAVTPAVDEGDGMLTVTATAPDVSALGWTVISFNAVAIKDQDATMDTDYTVYTGTPDTMTPYSVEIDSLTNSQAYQVGAWFVYQRSTNALDLAYGAAIGASYTPASG